MIKKFAAFFAVLTIVLSLSFTAYASSDFVMDDYGLLSDSELQDLNSSAEEISLNHDCGVYVMVVNDYTDYVDTNEIREAGNELFLSNNLGFNSDQSGILLLLSMEDRDYTLRVHGTAKEVFSSDAIFYLEDSFLDDLGNNDWCTAFDHYLSTCDEILYDASQGIYMDGDTDAEYVDGERVYSSSIPSSFHAAGVVCCILIGFLIALFVLNLLKQQLRSVIHETYADNFVSPSGLQLSERSDIYTHTTQSRVYDPPQRSSSSGGGGGGFSGSSGKF